MSGTSSRQWSVRTTVTALAIATGRAHIPILILTSGRGEAAASLGLTVEEYERTYLHNDPNFQQAAADAF
ncbi:MAG: hypothetical protein KAY22_19485 [Rhizorhabdus sp.]|uniref:hypothetical protein n=1 Tax=Rhizorhabdus sp. TaxID=1968843 RepID=UPI001B79937A|nr:hypothetical protein [Rhizorhabdus sp.]MBP8234481.1 hypothetical protein [Rhizorhabdus sp.]